jgi:hypothetical protein
LDFVHSDKPNLLRLIRRIIASVKEKEKKLAFFSFNYWELVNERIYKRLINIQLNVKGLLFALVAAARDMFINDKPS